MTVLSNLGVTFVEGSMTLTPSSDMDFPAAHSMDATWFAVDRDGHVGVFDSGEPGAVPKEVNDSIGQDDYAVEQVLDPLPVIAEPEFKLSAVLHPGLRSGVVPRRKGLPSSWPAEGGAELLLFRDASLLTPHVRALPGLHVGRAGPFVLVSLKPDVELTRHDPRWGVWNEFKRASAGSTYITYAKMYGQDFAWDKFKRAASAERAFITYIKLSGRELALARRGLFFYRAHDARFNIAEPYGQVLAPQRPLCLDEAPDPIRDVLMTRARLDISFASSPYVQPMQHVPCAVWAGAVFLDSDGFTVRPFPGTGGAAYRSEAASLLGNGSPEYQSFFKPLVFDPPLGQESP